MRVRDDDGTSLVTLADITEIELVILKRMRDVTMGDHRSRQHGTGFDFVGLRDWQPGDRFSSIDWGQSSLTNFAPLIVRDFEQPSTATVICVADVSLSTRCGINGMPIAAPVARSIATIGLSAVFFQDPFGLITFDSGFDQIGGIRPRTGKSHVVHCLDAYERQRNMQEIRRTGSISQTIAGYVRNPSLMAVISDATVARLKEALPPFAILRNPIDITGQYLNDPDLFRRVFSTIGTPERSRKAAISRAYRGLAAAVTVCRRPVPSSCVTAGMRSRCSGLIR